MAHLRTHGMPDEELAGVRREEDRVGELVRIARPVTLLDAGDRVDGWAAAHMPGHADGHLAFFRDDGAMLAGDVLLGQITPNVGLWPHSRPDPLGDFLASLEEIVRRAPRVAYPGHGRVIEDPPARAREILGHHAERLEATLDTLGDGPRSAYEASLELFADGLSPALRRFAVVETLAHLHHLAATGAAERVDGDLVRYAAA
jgi:glyoxylase-like metal-dependent hydrolase (beta-lactamase superfamily II)